MIPNAATANVIMPVSTKYTINIGKWIKGDNVDKAIRKLESVAKKETALPIVRFKKDTSHKRGISAGRYPLKTVMHVIKALKLVKSNAKHKSLDDSKLVINEFMPNMVFSQRQRAKHDRGRLTSLKIGVRVEEK